MNTIALNSFLPHCVHLLFARRLRLAHKQMPCLLRAPRNLQEFVKLQHSALAAGPSFAALVEDRVSWVVHTLLIIASSRSGIRSSAALPSAGSVGRHLQVRIIRLGLWRRRGLRGGCRGYSSRDSLSPSILLDGLRLRRRLDNLRRLGGRCIVDGGVFAGGAWRDGQEFLKGQNAGLAAFPA